MKRKSIMIIILILLVMISTFTNASTLLKVNGRNINFSIEPEEIEAETLIPIDQFKNTEGFFMQSIGEDKILIIYETSYYVLSLESKEVRSDKHNFNICCKPIKINEYILIPFDLIEIIFGEDINEVNDSENKINLELNINQNHFDNSINLIVGIKINNNTDESINLEFSTSQKYNIIIKNEEDDIIYDWEKEKMFTQAFTNNLIKSNNSIEFTEKIDISDFNAGSYKLIVELKAIGFQNKTVDREFTIYN